MQAIGDIISYFFPYYFNCHAKKCTKSNWGKIYDIFSPSVFIFSPLGHAIIFLLSQTVYWGEYFSRWTQSFFVTISELSISTGGKYMIFFPLSLFFPQRLYFFPLCLHFFPPRPCNWLFYFRGRCTGGKYSLSMFFPLAMLYGIYFTFPPRQLLGYELEEK